MIAVDTNILVYAHRRESRHGDAAYELLRILAEGDQPWASLCRHISVAASLRRGGRVAF